MESWKSERVIEKCGQFQARTAVEVTDVCEHNTNWCVSMLTHRYIGVHCTVTKMLRQCMKSTSRYDYLRTVVQSDTCCIQLNTQVLMEMQEPLSRYEV